MKIEKPKEAEMSPEDAGAEDASLEAALPQPSETPHGLLSSALVTGIFTFLSRIMGLIRFRVMGHYFGNSAAADAFNLAFIFPNLTRRIFGEGLLTTIFIPVFSSQQAKNQKEAANKTASVLLVRLAYWLSVGCIAVIAVSAGTRLAFASKFTPDQILKFKLFEALLPYCVFINLAAVLMAVLNSLGKFWVPAFAPVLWNLAIILACLFALNTFGPLPEQQIWVVAIAALAGGALQFLIQFPAALAAGFRFKFSADKTDPGYREIVENFKPLVLTVALLQLNTMLDNMIAQVFIAGDGPVTYMNMGTSIYQLAFGVMALAIGTAALPMLSRQYAQNDKTGFERTYSTAVRYTIYLSIPFAFGAMLLSDDIVKLLYGSGKFLVNDAEPVKRTAAVAYYSCLGLPFYSLNAIQTRALYAMKDFKTPARTTLEAVALNFGLNLFFVFCAPLISAAIEPRIRTWAVENTFGNDIYNGVVTLGLMRESGIILAGTLSAAWQTWALGRAIRKNLNAEHPVFTKEFSLRIFGVSLASALIGLYVYRISLPKSADEESLFALAKGCAAFLGPMIWINYLYFESKQKRLRESLKVAPEEPISDEKVPETLKIQYALYATISAASIMAIVVWATRESLPPEGKTWVQIAQRGLAPVIVGIMAYSVASSSLMSREYEELWGMFRRKRKT